MSDAIPTEKLDAVLAYEFETCDGKFTVRSYLKALLVKLLEKGEAFSGKRPFGNGGWEAAFAEPLIACEIIKGEIYREEGYLPSAEDYSDREMNAAMMQVVDRVFGNV